MLKCSNGLGWFMANRSKTSSGLSSIFRCTCNKASPLSLSCTMVLLKYVFSLLKTEIDRSHPQVVTGRTASNFKMVNMFGNVRVSASGNVSEIRLGSSSKFLMTNTFPTNQALRFGKSSLNISQNCAMLFCFSKLFLL